MSKVELFTQQRNIMRSQNYGERWMMELVLTTTTMAVAAMKMVVVIMEVNLKEVEPFSPIMSDLNGTAKFDTEISNYALITLRTNIVS